MKPRTVLPTVELFWRDPDGTHKKSIPWSRPATVAALHEWIKDYSYLVDEGYQRAGFELAPRPHFARILLFGKVIAEWTPSYISPVPSVESPVTTELPPAVGSPHAASLSPSTAPVCTRPASSTQRTAVPDGILPKKDAVNDASATDGTRVGQGSRHP